MVPDKKKPEWKDLITGNSNHKISSFSLQMKINSLRLVYQYGKITIDQAVEDLYQTCQKFERIYQHDIDTIFNGQENKQKA
ncbi:MAG: hypothetical protein HC906_00170 [Bacteroidales bacterium]|nr:hypothetical protein [Bacteroidales bacterium]